MFVLVTANYGSSNLYQTHLRISSVDRLAQTASLETASQLCADYVYIHISVRLNKVDYTTGGNPCRHREKMATSTNICILASSKWRDISKKKNSQDRVVAWEVDVKPHFKKKSASHTEDPRESLRMKSCWRYVWSDKCLIRGWWCGIVRCRLHPVLLNKPSHTMISAVATYNLRQAAAPPTCADLSRSISLPL